MPALGTPEGLGFLQADVFELVVGGGCLSRKKGVWECEGAPSFEQNNVIRQMTAGLRESRWV